MPATTRNPQISPGDTVVVTDAYGVEHTMSAVSGVEKDGHDFPIVWVAVEGVGRIPWPVESVRPKP
jgi:hypothetical protein